MNAKKTSTTSSTSCAGKPSRTKSPTSQGSPTRSRGRQTQGGSRPSSGHNRKTSPVSHSNSEKNDEHGGRTGSRSSSSSSSSSSTSSTRHVSRSPPRPVKPISPVRANQTHNEYHLKYMDNEDIRQWLRTKNSELRHERKERKRLKRARRRQQQEQQQAKDERHRESEMLVQMWMEEKKMERRMLNKRQQQNPKTLENRQQGTKPAKDKEGRKNPGANNQGGQKGFNLKSFKGQDGKNTFPVKDGKSKVPMFSRLGMYDTFPGAGTWKSPGKKMSQVERRKAYGDWLRKNQTGELPVKNQSELAFVDDDHEVQTESSSVCVPHPPSQGSEKTGRCASAGVGRRRNGECLSPRMRGRRPLSSKPGMIGTRLEPQGADRMDPVSEVDNTEVSKSKQDNAENTTPDQEVTYMKTPERDSSNLIVPHVSFEFEEERTTSRTSCTNVTPRDEDLEKVSEDQKNKSEVAGLSPAVNSGRDLLNTIESESRFLPVFSEGETSRSNSYLEEQRHSPEKIPTAEEEQHSEERQEEESEARSGEDGQEKTLNTARTSSTAAVSSSTCSLDFSDRYNNDDDDGDDDKETLP